MSNQSILIHVAWVLAIVVAGIVLTIAPLIWIARRILSPIDRAGKFRKAAARFSIGDFLCLFLAIQIPLAAIHRFVGEDSIGTYWAFTIITWLVAPVIWFAGARALSKAQIIRSSHRFVFLGLIMPLVYYGLVPFTLLGLAFLAPLAGDTNTPFRSVIPAWFVLAILFFVSGRYVQWMLQQVQSSDAPISDREHENELFRAAMSDASTAARVRPSHGNGQIDQHR
jgi:hypothetical protein